MISRVAEHCFWMSRYVERLENTARVLDVNRTLLLDFHVPLEQQWKPLLIISGIHDMPGVAESAVVGVPHRDFGEAVIAVVVPRPGATLDGAEISARLKQQIANFKVPKQVFVVPELPRNTMGKVQKNLLREQYKDIYARQLKAGE